MTVTSRLSQRGDVLKRFADQGLVSIGNFATSVLVARMLGPQQFGLFALVWTVVVFALTAQWALITAPMQSSLAQADAKSRQELFGALCSQGFILGLLAVLGTAVIVMCAATTKLATIGEIAPPVLAITVQDFVRRWLLATERPGLALISDGLRQAGSVGVLLLMSGSHTMGLPTCMLIIGVGGTLGCAPVVSDLRDVRLSAATAISWARRHSEVAKWLMPSVVLQSVNASAPLYMLGGTLGVGAVGGYRAAVALASPIVILTEALETFLPLRARQAMLSGGPRHLWYTLRSCALLFLPLCVTYVAILGGFGPAIIRVAYGSAYASYAPLLLILGFASLLQFGGYMLNVALRALERSSAIFVGDVTATLVLTILLLLTVAEATPAKAALCVAIHQAVKLLVLAVSGSRVQAPVWQLMPRNNIDGTAASMPTNGSERRVAGSAKGQGRD